MSINILFNWPPGQDSARIILGSPNVNDKEFDFRIGVILKNNADKIYWQKEWISGEDIQDIAFNVKRGDKIVVERKQRNKQDSETRNTWDIDKEWPSTATGATSTNTPWNF